MPFDSDEQRKAVMANLNGNKGPHSSSVSNHDSEIKSEFNSNKMYNSNPDNYVVVDDTFYKKTTPKGIVDALEYARKNKHRVKISLGDSVYGWDWGDGKTNDGSTETGTIGRSSGPIKVPLLIKTSRSMGGGAILTDSIVKVEDTTNGRTLYKHPKYHVVKTIGDINNDDDIILVQNDDEIEEIKNERRPAWGKQIDEFDGFFVHQKDGNVSAVWGFHGSVPDLDKSLTRLV